MLTRIGALVLILLIMSALVLIGARANGVPTSDSAALFQPTPNCRPPCWHGITPGKTTIEEAIAILRADQASIQSVSLQSKGYLSWDFTAAMGSGNIRSWGNNAPKVVEIQIQLERDHILRLGDAILLWGQPLSAQLQYCDPFSIDLAQAEFQFAGNVKATVYYDDFEAYYRQRTPLNLPLDPSIPITHILFHTDLYNYTMTGPAVWKGFKHWTAENSVGGMCGVG